MRVFRTHLIGLAALVLAGCGSVSAAEPDADTSAPQEDADTPDAGPPDGSPCEEPPSPEFIDCTATTCSDLSIEGDDVAPPPGFFRGYSDPTVRSHPVNPQFLWMAYSYPEAVELDAPDGGKVEVHTSSIHLAHSSDQGATWQAHAQARVLWPAESMVDPDDAAQTGILSSEVVSLTAQKLASSVVWYAVRLTYYVPPADGYNPRASSFQFRVTRANSPALLGQSTEEQSLGSTHASGAFAPDVVLSDLSPDLMDCGFWNDPGLFFSDGRLYLAAQCQVYDQNGAVDAAGRITLFSTDPTGPVEQWQWSYLGVLADHTVAQELGQPMLNQTDLARGVDGKLLLIATPSYTNASGQTIHLGCRALEIETLDPPELARQCGTLKVRAHIETSDVASGSGACGYDPELASGIIQVRRPATQNGRWELRRTGLRP